MIVKKGDTLEVALAPEYLGQAKQLDGELVWKSRQMNLNGTFTEWQAIGTSGTGTTFEFAATQSGIFELEAVAVSSNAEIFYVRKGDDYFSVHKNGEHDCFGVVDADWQLNVHETASVNLGNTAYAYNEPNPPFGRNQNKCDEFVWHKATDAGAIVPLVNGGLGLYPTSPPTANQWAGTEVIDIPNWEFSQDDAKPQPGFVVARGHAGGPGHCGILDYDGAWISAGPSDVNRKADLRYPLYQPARVRRYTGQ